MNFLTKGPARAMHVQPTLVSKNEEMITTFCHPFFHSSPCCTRGSAIKVINYCSNLFCNIVLVEVFFKLKILAIPKHINRLGTIHKYNGFVLSKTPSNPN